ncbi:MAG: lysozyme inhibitor LprI family protein [Bdellovibrio sp.]
MKKLIFSFIILSGTFAHAEAADIRAYVRSCIGKSSTSLTIIMCNKSALNQIDHEIADVVKKLEGKLTDVDGHGQHAKESLITALSAEMAAFQTLRDSASTVDAILAGGTDSDNAAASSSRKVSISLFELNSLEMRSKGETP